MTSKDDDKTLSNKVKTKKKLKVGDPDEESIHGRDVIEQTFSSKQKAEFMEKNPIIQNEISQTIDKYNKDIFSRDFENVKKL